MGFFNRGPRGNTTAAAGADTAPVSAPVTKESHWRHGRRRREPYSMERRPTFGVWLKHTWLDILTMIIMGAVGLGVSPHLWE